MKIQFDFSTFLFAMVQRECATKSKRINQKKEQI